MGPAEAGLAGTSRARRRWVTPPPQTLEDPVAPVRCLLSAAETVAVGRVNERRSRLRIETSAQPSLADAVIEDLPEDHGQTPGKRFKSLTKVKTAVLIPHRFSAVRVADRIVVLDGDHVEAVRTVEGIQVQGHR